MKSQSAVIAFAVMLSACVHRQPVDGQKDLIDASRQELAEAISERDRLLSLVTEISTMMDEIKRLERIMMLSDASHGEKNTDYTRLAADMSAVKFSLQQRRAELASLEERLKESGLYTDDLSRTVDALRHLTNSQSRDIEALQSRLASANQTIDSLNVAVDSLNSSVKIANISREAAEEDRAMLEDEINTCFYVVANQSALKEHKIIETAFLRKTRLMKGDFDQDFFEIGDKRLLDMIVLGEGKASVLTNHPISSYSINSDGESSTLVITDSDRFWSLTNYLVIRLD